MHPIGRRAARADLVKGEAVRIAARPRKNFLEFDLEAGPDSSGAVDHDLLQCQGRHAGPTARRPDLLAHNERQGRCLIDFLDENDGILRCPDTRHRKQPESA
jgi:hypothetical protein